MRRQLAVVLLAVALPLAAQDGQPVQQPDSPLVAAAKRMNRKGKKPALVITNATLRQSGAASGAHVTTTASQSTLKVPAPLPPLRPTPEMEAAAARVVREKQLTEQAARKKLEADAAQRKTDRDAATAEDLYYGGDRDDAEPVETTPPPQV